MLRFGDWHTIHKLEILKLYAEAYAALFSVQTYLEGVYVDAFAGSGSGVTKTGMQYDGSPRIALNFDRSFEALHFIDAKEQNARSLRDLAAKFPKKSTHIHQGNANFLLPSVLSKLDWSKSQALVFIDPFGLEFHWAAMEKILSGTKIDVWFLFPVQGSLRLLRDRPEDLKPENTRHLDNLFGSQNWRSVYRVAPSMFNEEDVMINAEKANILIDQYIAQLKPITSCVAEPIPLFDRNNIHQFSLIFLMNNEHERAITRAKKLVSQTKSRLINRIGKLS